jgi:hypothetical protein
LFVQLFVNAAHVRFGENYIRTTQQLVLDIAVLAKTSLFGPKKADVKAAADSLLNMRVGCAGSPGGRPGAATSKQEEATGSPGETPKALVDLEASTWNHAVCSLEPTNLVKKKFRKYSKMTRVKSIAGIDIGHINWKQLGAWCSCNGISGTGSVNKDVLCKNIVIFVSNMERS